MRHGTRDYPERVSESAEAASSTEETPDQVSPVFDQGDPAFDQGDPVSDQTNPVPDQVSPMSDPVNPGPGQANSAFRERLYASWWTWPLPLVIAVLLGAEVHMGHPGVRAWLPYLVLVPLAVLVPLLLGRTKVEVVDGELRAGDARLPLRFVEDAETIDPGEKRRALGPNLDPAAFVLHRAWVRGAVRVWLDDEDDPTPYWILSTRRPQELVDALRSTTSSSPT